MLLIIEIPHYLLMIEILRDFDHQQYGVGQATIVLLAGYWEPLGLGCSFPNESEHCKAPTAPSRLLMAPTGSLPSR